MPGVSEGSSSHQEEPPKDRLRETAEGTGGSGFTTTKMFV